MELEGLTGQIIGAAIAVHRELGPGFLESVYEEALCLELAELGLKFRRQVYVPIHYRDKQVGEHRLDLLVEELVVVELKTISAFEDIHFATVRSYLKATDRQHGLLLNFAAKILTAKRVSRERSARDA
ncbi:MAG: GxxExxY protein [Opitutaceae bacterium]|jgi:GxxExxY protein